MPRRTIDAIKDLMEILRRGGYTNQIEEEELKKRISVVCGAHSKVVERHLKFMYELKIISKANGNIINLHWDVLDRFYI